MDLVLLGGNKKQLSQTLINHPFLEYFCGSHLRLQKLTPLKSTCFLVQSDLSSVLYDNVRELLESQGFPILYASASISRTRSLLSQIIVQRLNITKHGRGIALNFNLLFGQINYYLATNDMRMTKTDIKKHSFLRADIIISEIRIVFRTDGTPSSNKKNHGLART